MAELEQKLTIRIGVDGKATLEQLPADINKVGDAAKHASSESSSAFAGMSQAVSSFTGVLETLKATVAALGIVEAFHLASEAIKEVAGAGDRLRDMTAALQGVVGSAQGAAAALTLNEVEN